MYRKTGFVTVLVLLIMAVFFAGSLAVPPQAAAQSSESGTITVNGYGEVFGTPDVARISLGVEIRNENIGAAMSEADDTIRAIIAALGELNIPAEDVQTVNFSVWSDTPPGPDGSPDASQILYRVSNILRVNVRDTEAVQPVIDAAVNAGANVIHGLEFNIDDPAELEAAARVAALADARDRAEQIAAGIGATLGNVVMVREGSGGDVPFIEAAAMGRGGGGIQEGQLSVRVGVAVSYEIVR